MPKPKAKSGRRVSKKSTAVVDAPSRAPILVATQVQAQAQFVAAGISSIRLPEPALVPDIPPLPDTIEVELAAQDGLLVRQLRAGCYLMRYTPPFVLSPIVTHYDGTFRVDRNASVVTASGDLYTHRTVPGAFPQPVTPEPNPSAGIPIFPRSRYAYYLRVVSVAESPLQLNPVVIRFNLFSYNAISRSFKDLGIHTATLRWGPPPAGFPSGNDFLSGDVRNASSGAAGTMTLAWISRNLRRATIEIDHHAQAERPLDNGAGVGWQAIFDQVGWQVTVTPSNNDVVEPSGESWSDGEMHAAMLARRDFSNLDAEWRYHVLCVRRIDSTPRGIMYDSGAVDSNNVPREGVGISSHWVTPDTAAWGLVRNTRFGTAPGPYFRTAVHEIGHAMGLYHNTIDLGIMNTTDVIAASSVGTPTPFPNNIQWSHAADDQRRLRHLPDMHVRPGGLPFGTPYGPDEALDAEGIDIEVQAIMSAFPIGAPVRVEFALYNSASVPLPVPKSLSMRAGHVRGYVIDPSGNLHPFLPMLLCVESNDLELLPPGERRSDSLTLLRGPKGSLFPAPGAYRIVVEVSWDVGGFMVARRGETTAMITSADSESHADAALKVLSTPDTVVALIVGGDHLTEGIAAIHAALADETLRPHYAAIEAKRVCKRFGKRDANYNRAAELLDDTVITTRGELKKLATMAKDGPKKYAATVHATAQRNGADDIADDMAIGK